LTSHPDSPPEKDERSEFIKDLDRAMEEAGEQVAAEMAAATDRQQRGHATRPPRPTGRTTPIAVRFDEFTIKRLRALAERRKTGYQTLLKQFVVERIYEEEKRDRVID
jgi:hypothetical protein